MGEDLDAGDSPLVHIDTVDGARLRIRRQWLHRLTTGVLGAVVLAAAVDALGLYPAYGVDSRHATAAGGGYELDVRYAAVSRPAVATPLDIEVRRPGGFDGPVTVGISSDYLSMWDDNGLDPAPSRETAFPGLLVWEFEPPNGNDTLTVSFDARIEPAAQQGRRGTVSVLDSAGAPLTSVSFRTRLRP